MIRAVLAWLLMTTAAFAQSGEAAFSDGDYAAARDIWQEEARAGDPDAAFGLGVLSDLGLGGPRDPARAFRYYLAAADVGHPEAQFNVAVMIDAGTVRDPDPAAAAVWYARAAANGVPRAAFNLGVLYKEGIGVPTNADLARYWLGEAAGSVPAAADALRTVDDSPDPEDLPEPRPQGDFTVSNGDGPSHAELVWTSAPATQPGPVTVELVRLSGGPGERAELIRQETEASALSIPLPDAGRYAWRVLRVAPDGSRYAASRWTGLTSSVSDADLPKGRVTLSFGRDDGDARRLAETLAILLTGNGYVVSILPDAQQAEASRVSYGFPSDLEMAESVAAALPASVPVDAAADGLDPGEARIVLAGGLAPSPE